MSAIASTSLIKPPQFTASIKCDRRIDHRCAPFDNPDLVRFSFLGKTPFISALQYIASGAMGNAAFTGGLATALLGLVLEFLMTIIIAGVFILSADRIPLLRQHVIVGSLLYGFGVFIVMVFIVLPLSAAPPLPAPQIWLFIEIILEHILLIGLPLGILVRRNG